MKQTMWIAMALAAVLFAAPAGATSCKQWNRLGPDGKADTVVGLIQSIVYGNTARSYKVPKPQVERCAMGKLNTIVIAVDDVCSDSRTAGKQAPRRTVDRHLISCIGN